MSIKKYKMKFYSFLSCAIYGQFLLIAYFILQRGTPTVCPGSSDPFYIVSYYIKWVNTSCTPVSTLILQIYILLLWCLLDIIEYICQIEDW